jgi:hypothetical protein
MVLCLKCAEALGDMIFGIDPVERLWFPSSFLISEKRLAAGKFQGRILIGDTQTESEGKKSLPA